MAKIAEDAAMELSLNDERKETKKPRHVVIAINHLSEREVITCYHCKLVQFRTANDLCRRCHKPPPQIAAPDVEPAPAVERSLSNRATLSKACAAVLRIHRIGLGWSQENAAKALGHESRTYISKIETDNCLPSLQSLERIAHAYLIRLSALVREIEIAQSLME